MGPLVALLFMLSAFTLWMFFKFQPVTPLAKVLKTVNRLFVGLAVTLAVLAVVRVYTTYTDPGDKDLVPQLALVWGFGLLFVVMMLGFLIRNFVIFRTPRY